MRRLDHLLSGLQVGGKERVALDLARRGRNEHLDHRLLLFDTPFRDEQVDFAPGDVPVALLPRGPGLDLRFAWRLARRWRRERVDVVHAHNDTAVFYAGLARLLMAPGRRPTMVGTFHTRPGHDTPSARTLTRWAARRLDAITAVSAELADTLARLGWVDRCEVLENGVDLASFAPEGPSGGWHRELDVPDGALVIASIGRLDPIKRQVDLIAAGKRLAAADVPCVIVLVGQGPMQHELEREACGAAWIRFVPRVVDVAGFLRDVDVLVLCSDHEAAPKVLLEAMACGVAIVASDVGGVRDILTDASGAACGRLVPARRPDVLAAALHELGADARTRIGLAERARRRATAFSAEAEWDRYVALYTRRGPQVP